MNSDIFRNEFSWSKSRYEIFSRCQRMYYLRYYGSWGGWLEEADERKRKLYVLQKLQTRQMWAGQKVHECIANVLKKAKSGKNPVGINEEIDRTIAKMRREFMDSKRGRYWKEPKTCALFEHEYEVNLPDIEWKKTANHVIQCIKTFYESDIYRLITQFSSEQFLDIENLSDFFLEGTKVFVKIDFVCRKDNDICLYDWKTGKAEVDTHKLQAGCYCLYSIQNWNVTPKQVKISEFYLSGGEQNEYILSEKDLDSIIQDIIDSIKEMRNLLDDPQENSASEENFSFAEDERVCDYCNFRKLCPQIFNIEQV